MNRIYHLGFLPNNKSVASLGLVHTVLKVEPEKLDFQRLRSSRGGATLPKLRHPRLQKSLTSKL